MGIALQVVLAAVKQNGLAIRILAAVPVDLEAMVTASSLVGSHGCYVCECLCGISKMCLRKQFYRCHFSDLVLMHLSLRVLSMYDVQKYA